LFSPLGLFGLKPENNRFFLLLPPGSFWASWMHLFENFRFGLASFKTSPVGLSDGRILPNTLSYGKKCFCGLRFCFAGLL